MSNMKHNEHVKMLAAFFSNLGVASFATAALAPLITAQENPGGFSYLFTLPVGALLAFCCVGLSQLTLNFFRES